ncbi:hypothetical protein ACWDTI_10520 [Gordonia sp. NPDC003424]
MQPVHTVEPVEAAIEGEDARYVVGAHSRDVESAGAVEHKRPGGFDFVTADTETSSMSSSRAVHAGSIAPRRSIAAYRRSTS